MLTKELEERIDVALQQLCYPSLLKGDMGVCLYYFILGRMRGDSQLTHRGELALEKIMSSTGRYKKLCIEDGITGFGLGITYLLRNHYVNGNEDEALREVDSYVYKGIGVVLENKESSTNIRLPFLDVLVYFWIRQGQVENAARKSLYRRLVAHLLNHIYLHRSDSFYQEAMPFNLSNESYGVMVMLAKIYEQGMERERIGRIFNEMKTFLFSNIPLLHANRLHLMTVARWVGKCIGDGDWLDFANRLSEGIDLRHILEEELTDKCILPMTGVVGVWILLEANRRMGFPVKTDIKEDELRRRILSSSLWDRIEKDGEYLSNCYSLDGYCGIKILLEYLERKDKHGTEI